MCADAGLGRLDPEPGAPPGAAPNAEPAAAAACVLCRRRRLAGDSFVLTSRRPVDAPVSGPDERRGVDEAGRVDVAVATELGGGRHAGHGRLLGDDSRRGNERDNWRGRSIATVEWARGRSTRDYASGYRTARFGLWSCAGIGTGTRPVPDIINVSELQAEANGRAALSKLPCIQCLV